MRGRGAAGIFLTAFAAYLFRAYPCLAPRDAGDLALAALKLGVAHPPGYPLYSVLGHAWIGLLPLGTAAYRLNILSAMAGALSVAGLYAWCRRRLAPLAAAGCAAAYGAAAPVLKFSALGEKYSLQALILVVILLTLEGRRESIIRRAALSGLLFGLMWVNHQTAILALPMLALLWRAEIKRHDVRPRRVAAAFVGWAILGAALSLFVWIRLGSLAEAWRVWTRADYGTFSLFSGFARPLGEAAGGLLAHLGAGALGWGLGLGALLALGAFLKPAALEWALAAGWLCYGPVFFLMTRFDVSNWVARSALETAFIIPLLLMAALAACALSRLRAKPAAWLSCALAAACLLASAPSASRRFDFSAYDYLRDLSHAAAPGSAVVAGGDTALFGLRLEQARGRFQGRELRGELDAAGRADVVTGMSLGTLRGLGIDPARLRPAGLVQRVDAAEPPEPWEFSALRPAPDPGDSYAHDVRLAYAFAHYLDGMIERDPARSAWEQKWAVVLDPEDYSPAR